MFNKAKQKQSHTYKNNRLKCNLKQNFQYLLSNSAWDRKQKLSIIKTRFFPCILGRDHKIQLTK